MSAGRARAPRRIAVVGGTGREGRGLARRWAAAGHPVIVGSRDPDRARAAAAELAGDGLLVGGAGSIEAARLAEVVVLSVPYAAHEAALAALRPVLDGQVVLDVTVPLRPPRVREVWLPPGGSAAARTAALVGDRARVAAALHHVSAEHLVDPERRIDSDVLVCADDPDARAVVIGLVEDLGLRGLDAGPLGNAVALEALTPVLLHLNRRYGITAGLRITGLEAGRG